MLYEVITEELFRALSPLRQPFTYVVVITSYSIHYTKLYEGLMPGRVLRIPYAATQNLRTKAADDPPGYPGVRATACAGFRAMGKRYPNRPPEVIKANDWEGSCNGHIVQI